MSGNLSDIANMKKHDSLEISLNSTTKLQNRIHYTIDTRNNFMNMCPYFPFKSLTQQIVVELTKLLRHRLHYKCCSEFGNQVKIA